MLVCSKVFVGISISKSSNEQKTWKLNESSWRGNDGGGRKSRSCSTKSLLSTKVSLVQLQSTIRKRSQKKLSVPNRTYHSRSRLGTRRRTKFDLWVPLQIFSCLLTLLTLRTSLRFRLNLQRQTRALGAMIETRCRKRK